MEFLGHNRCRHNKETHSVLLAIYKGNPPASNAESFDVYLFTYYMYEPLWAVEQTF